MKKLIFILISTILLFSCKKEIQKTEYEGIVIGTFRGWGGGIGISMSDNSFSNVAYLDFNHVVEGLNIPVGLPKLTKIKFEARKATEEEKTFTRSTDGFEGAPIIYVTKYSVNLDDSIDISVSTCISNKINDYINQGNYPAVIAIHQYYYKNKICYLLSSNCCDRFNALVDNNCNFICSPTGGITGGGDGTCPDFNSNAIFISKIWSK